MNQHKLGHDNLEHENLPLGGVKLESVLFKPNYNGVEICSNKLENLSLSLL